MASSVDRTGQAPQSARRVRHAGDIPFLTRPSTSFLAISRSSTGRTLPGGTPSPSIPSAGGGLARVAAGGSLYVEPRFIYTATKCSSPATSTPRGGFASDRWAGVTSSAGATTRALPRYPLQSRTSATLRHDQSYDLRKIAGFRRTVGLAADRRGRQAASAAGKSVPSRARRPLREC